MDIFKTGTHLFSFLKFLSISSGPNRGGRHVRNFVAARIDGRSFSFKFPSNVEYVQAPYGVSPLLVSSVHISFVIKTDKYNVFVSFSSSRKRSKPYVRSSPSPEIAITFTLLLKPFLFALPRVSTRIAALIRKLQQQQEALICR
jgi:hypothetical protein